MKTTILKSVAGIAIAILFFTNYSRADHLAGGDFQWKNLGGDTFLITFTGYRDCNGIPMGGQSIELTTGKNQSIYSSISTTISSGIDITPVSKGTCTRCGKTPNGHNTTCKNPYGIEAFTFTAKVALDQLKGFKGNCQITMSWTSCCRSGTLTTGGNNQSFYIGASFNRCHGIENSPILSSAPLLIVAQNACVNYNPGAWDPDIDSAGNRDSLAYAIVKPLSGSSTPIMYTGKYSYDKPLSFDSFPKKNALWNPPSCAGFHLDPLTGELQFSGQKVESTVLAFSITEYRKDKKGVYYIIGQTTRDLQLDVVRTQGKHQPSLSGINGGISKDTFVCAGQALCFTINSSDADTSNSVHISWNASLVSRGASFTVQKGVKFPVSTFCWTPKASDVSTLPYDFAVSATDNGPGLVLPCIMAYRIFVRPALKDSISINRTCQDVSFTASAAYNSSRITNYQWYGDDSLNSTSATFRHTYKKPGTYKYYVMVKNAASCSELDSGTVTIPAFLPAPAIALTGTDSLVASGNASAFIWHWDSILLPDSGKKILAAALGSYRVQAVDSNGCLSGMSSPYTFTITGIGSAIANTALRIYPNPTTGLLTIETPGLKEAQVSLFNLEGQNVLQSNLNTKTELDLHLLPKGIYMLKVQSRESIRIERIILQ